MSSTSSPPSPPPPVLPPHPSSSLTLPIPTSSLLHTTTGSMSYLRTFTALLTHTKINYTIPTSFLRSPSFSLVNPRHHPIGTDTVSLTVPLSSLLQNNSGKRSLNPEVLVARFLKGFFNGWIFFPEFLLLMRLGGSRLLPVGVEGLEIDERAEEKLLKPSDLPNDVLPPIGTKITESFQVIGKYVDTDPSSRSGSEEQDKDGNRESEYSYSYVDVAFGSTSGTFAGCHRLGVRLPSSVAPSSQGTKGETEPRDDRTQNDDAEQTVEFSVECFTCNPSRDEHSIVEPIRWFHYGYARSLLADGVVGVLRGSTI